MKILRRPLRMILRSIAFDPQQDGVAAATPSCFVPFGESKDLTYFKTVSNSRATVPSSSTKQGMPMPPPSRMSA